MRRANRSDLEALWRLANEPSVLANRLTPRSIPLDEHVEWFSRKLASNGSAIWVLMAGDELIGQVRYDTREDRIAEIDYAIAEAHRGRGLGAALLRSTAARAGRLLGVTGLRGVVLENNVASTRAFAKAGFRSVGEASTNGRQCHVFELTLDERIDGIALVHVNGGPGIGLGHAARGAGLCQALREDGWRCELLCPDDANLIAWLAQAAPDVPVRPVRGDVDGLAAAATGGTFLCVDSYGLTSADLRRLNDLLPVVCFDDGARPDLAVSVVVNAAFGASTVGYRRDLNSALLLGPSYQVLRPQITAAGHREVSDRVRRLLVTIGGDDPAGALPDLLTMLGRRFSPEIVVEAVVGPFVGADLPTSPQLRVRRQQSDLAPLMHEADAAISAGGQTLCELAYCGTPTIGVMTGDDQALNLSGLAGAGAVMSGPDVRRAGWIDQLSVLVDRLCSDRDLRQSLQVKARSVIDGRGGRRIADAIAAIVATRRRP